MKQQEWIRTGRKALGLSQGALGEKLGVSQVQVSQWETGKSAPSPEQEVKLKKLFGNSAPEPKEAPVAQKPAKAKAAPANKGKEKNGNGANLGFEAELFKAADKLRGNMEPSDYKHVALGLIFLKHISDSFEAKRAQLLTEYPEGAEDPDEYAAENVFWVPKEARWSHLQASAKQPSIGKLIDEAML